GPNAETPRGGIVSFNVKGVGAAEVAHVLDRRGVAVRAGAHCAQPLLRHIGAEAVCRASIAAYTIMHDIDRF
ncbi:aminotransferase class V-fold PLP-dependent enzyme, partial [Bacteroides xylanisolvens]|nr:aminotransferase class V-fold PLP-dependent enzyme [Bacteroides xylanisolvens]